MNRRLAWSMMVLLAASSAGAWEMRGHSLVAHEAVLLLPEEVPEFFRQGAATVGHASIDPDVMKHRETPQLRHREYPEHFLDYELVDEQPLPEMRYDFVALAADRGQAPDRVGFVPYAITENTQRLSLAFAEHRCWPEDPHIRSKALIYAGLLSHYASDMVQPLHTSVHYDGRAGADGESPRSGIHGKMDSLFLQPGFEAGAGPAAPEVFADLWLAVRGEFEASFSQVERVYGFESNLDALYEGGEWDPELRRFAEERYARTLEFLSSLYLTAWRQSESLGFWDGFTREQPDGSWKACGEE